MSNPAIHQVSVQRDGVTGADFVAVEEPLEIRLGRLSLLVVMRTPGHDEELAAGLLWTEGIISRPEQIVDIRHCAEAEDASPGNVIVIDLAADTVIDAERLRRSIYASSSCGVCGKASIDAVRQRITPLRGSFRVEWFSFSAIFGDCSSSVEIHRALVAEKRQCSRHFDDSSLRDPPKYANFEAAWHVSRAIAMSWRSFCGRIQR